MNATETWAPEYEPWRHGGWYVTNVSYPSGAVGCVSRNYAGRKWRIVCAEDQHEVTYANRDAAARAEKLLADSAPCEAEANLTATKYDKRCWCVACRTARRAVSR